MTEIINHDLRVVNGGTLYMPPWEGGNDKWGNLALPDVYAIGTTQLYPTGTIYRKGVRTFVYTLTDATYYGEYGAGGLIAGYLMESAATKVELLNKVISGSAGSNTIVIEKATTAENAYAGGFMSIQKGTLTRQTVGGVQTFQIISNTVQDASNHVTFTLDGNLVIDAGTTDDVVLTEHPYACVRHPTDGPYGMVMGVLLCTTVASSYLWLQTGGPHNAVHSAATLQGDGTYEVPVYAELGAAQRSQGHASGTPSGSIDGTSMQRIGYTYASSKASGALGASASADTIGMAVWLTILN